MQPLRSVKGMNDILPEEMAGWRRVEEGFRQISRTYGYDEVRTPLVEPTPLFVRSIGDTTDIVEKEMYTFVDKGDDSLTLRPEGTASAARAYIQHTVHAREAVSKWIYLGPMYRRERPAKGRYRQFHQLGAEVFGDPGPYVDAEVIEMLVRYLDTMGVQDIEVLVNSLGSGDTRERYRQALLDYLTPVRGELSDDSQRRLDKNPLRVLDSKAAADQEIAAKAPTILAHLSDEDREHFQTLEHTLDAMGTNYRVEPRLVRGLDYYTRTLFEVRGRGGQLGAQDAICGGGRYDGLVKQLGGPHTPAIGFAIGIERLLLTMEQAGTSATLDAFVIAATSTLREEAALILSELRAAGLAADGDLRGNSLKSQMRRADKSGARLALIVGDNELGRGMVQVRDMGKKEQTELPRSSLAKDLERMVRASSGPAPIGVAAKEST